MSSKDLTTPEAYSFWSEEKIRFADVDRYGHLNNVANATYSENARVEFLEEIIPGCTSGSGMGWVILKLEIIYKASAYHPNNVRIGTHIEKIGNSSLILKQGMFCQDKCIALAENVLVWADIKAEEGYPIPDDIKEKLSAYM